MKCILSFVAVYLTIFHFASGAAISSTKEETDESILRFLLSVLNSSYRDLDVSPCDDFYQYACGNFEKIRPRLRGSDYSGVIYGQEKDLNELFGHFLSKEGDFNIGESQEVDVKVALNEVFKKMKVFYNSCMKANIFNFRKSESYVKFLKSIGTFPLLEPNSWDEKKFDFLDINAKLNSYGLPGLFQLHVNDDGDKIEIDMKEFAFKYTQVPDDKYSKKSQVNYAFVNKIFEMYDLKNVDEEFEEMKKFGSSLPVFNLDSIFELILSLMKPFSSRVKRDTSSESNSDESDESIANKQSFTIGDLYKKSNEDINWRHYVETVLSPTTTLNESIPVDINYNNFEEVLKYVKNYPNKKAIANYLMITTLIKLHNELSYNRYEQPFCTKQINRYFEGITDYIFINSELYDKNEEKKIYEIADSIRNSFAELIEQQEWIDSDTKAFNVDKVKNIDIVLGSNTTNVTADFYYEVYKDMEGLNENDYHGNLLKVRRYKEKVNLKFLLAVYDKDESNVLKSSVGHIGQFETNIFYVPSQNVLIMNSGSLIRPIYSPELPKSYNYGLLGSILGHEVTHSADSDTITRDKDYNEKDVKSSTLKELKKRFQCFENQYSNYTVKEIRFKINGTETLAENIADNGGMKASFKSFQEYRKTHPVTSGEKEAMTVFNLNDNQLFFLGFAQAHCGGLSKEAFLGTTNDEHTFYKFRVRGTVSNSPEFAKEFNCPVGSPMNPKNKCQVW